MGILEFILVALVLGIIVWLIQTYAPIPAQFKTIILWVAIAFLVLVLLHAFGILGTDWRIPQVQTK